MLQVYPNEDDLRVKAASYFASAIDGPEAFKRLMLHKGMKEMQDRKLPFVRPSSIDEKTWNSMAPRFTKEQDRSSVEKWEKILLQQVEEQKVDADIKVKEQISSLAQKITDMESRGKVAEAEDFRSFDELCKNTKVKFDVGLFSEAARKKAAQWASSIDYADLFTYYRPKTKKRQLVVRVARGVDAAFPHRNMQDWTDNIGYDEMELFWEPEWDFAKGESVLKEEMKLEIYDPATDKNPLKEIERQIAKKVAKRREREQRLASEAANSNKSSDAKSEPSDVRELFNTKAAMFGVFALVSVAAMVGLGIGLGLRLKNKKTKAKLDSVMKQRVARSETEEKGGVTDVKFASKLTKSRKNKIRASTDSPTETQ
eukprot:GHVT01058933.1.p1 GENE.GHVT01058933.1~~GHVT01058933.1.p1  ORF type:complete len:370 (-),score=50.04 GHVT01058933.1:275-1384(-)